MIDRDRPAALAAIEQWLRLIPTATGRARIHPEFAPLRGDPRFQRLVAKAKPTA